MSADMKLETVVIPVSDVDRAKAFYESLGWRLDADRGSEVFRLVQFTPPGSGCSIQFGIGLTSAAPGTALGLLVVSDIEAAHDELVGDGVEASEVFHDATGGYNRFDTDKRAKRPRSGTAHVRVVRGVQRSGRKRVATAGDHEPAARPRRPGDDHVQLRG